MVDSLEFPYRSARSAAITTAIVAVIVIESVAAHFAIASRNSALAWTFTLLSLTAVIWLVRDYRALGVTRVTLDDAQLRLMIGRRFDTSIPIANIRRVIAPTFRDLPTPGTNEGRDYLNLTRPAAPNVLIFLTDMHRVRLMSGLYRQVRRLSLRLDDPAGFIAAVEARRTVQEQAKHE
jgi:hypothetical protein